MLKPAIPDAIQRYTVKNQFSLPLTAYNRRIIASSDASEWLNGLNDGISTTEYSADSRQRYAAD
jgi:hypothetical protein